MWNKEYLILLLVFIIMIIILLASIYYPALASILFYTVILVAIPVSIIKLNKLDKEEQKLRKEKRRH